MGLDAGCVALNDAAAGSLDCAANAACCPALDAAAAAAAAAGTDAAAAAAAGTDGVCGARGAAAAAVVGLSICMAVLSRLCRADEAVGWDAVAALGVPAGAKACLLGELLVLRGGGFLLGLVGVSGGLGGGVPGLTDLEGCEPWDLLLPACGMVSCREVGRERGQAQELNSRPHWVIRKRQTHQLGIGVIRKRQTHTDFAF
jgi:hypothetical protein